jgi:DNA polymerase III sliding clamp (beta) subunit (PCNA family)
MYDKQMINDMVTAIRILKPIWKDNRYKKIVFEGNMVKAEDRVGNTGEYFLNFNVYGGKIAFNPEYLNIIFKWKKLTDMEVWLASDAPCAPCVFKSELFQCILMPMRL